MLKINMEYRKGILFVRLKGSLTRYNYLKFNNYMHSIIKDKGINYLVFNLELVKLIDHEGRECLKELLKEVKEGFICNSIFKLDNNFMIIENELVAFNTIKI